MNALGMVLFVLPRLLAALDCTKLAHYAQSNSMWVEPVLCGEATVPDLRGAGDIPNCKGVLGTHLNMPVRPGIDPNTDLHMLYFSL